MVAAEDMKMFRVFYFVGQEEADRLQGLLPPVHVVAEGGREGGREERREEGKKGKQAC